MIIYFFFSFLQENQEHLVTVMEERMMEVEQKLKLVKRLLQEKVNQLKEQVSLPGHLYLPTHIPLLSSVSHSFIAINLLTFVI